MIIKILLAIELEYGVSILRTAAYGGNREDRAMRIFSRFSWFPEFPHDQVLGFVDPAMQHDQRLNGAWFIDPREDIISGIASLVSHEARSKEIPSEKVVFYGSSLGGLGAIAAATLVPGSTAIAEVPQIDFGDWLPSAIQAVEDYIIGMPLAEYREQHPEQLSVIERIIRQEVFPKVRIITNPDDICYAQQRAFFEWARTLEGMGDVDIELIESSLTHGHQALPKHRAIQFLQKF